MVKVIKLFKFIKFVNEIYSFDKRFGTVLTQEIRTAKCCTEVFMILEHYINKLHKLESSYYMSPLRGIAISHQ